jgi:hypothetical protein
MKNKSLELNNHLTNYSSVKYSDIPVYTIFSFKTRLKDGSNKNIMILADFITFEILGYKLSSETFIFQDIISLLEENNLNSNNKSALYFSRRAPYTKKDLLIYCARNNIVPSCYKKTEEILQSAILKQFIKTKVRNCDKKEIEALLNSWKYNISQILHDR